MAAGDISKREITCWGHVGSSAASQKHVEDSQAGSETSTTHLLDDVTVGAKLSHTPSHGEKGLNSSLSSFTYSFFLKKDLFICFMYVNILSLSSDTPEEVIGSHYRWL